MNRTLLLILCDFLLLNILALTSWEKAEPARTPPQPVAPADPAEGAGTVEQDLVEVMKLSLEDERAQREQLASQLQSTEANLAEREQNLAGLQQEKAQLDAALDQTRRSAAELAQQVQAARADASMSKERLAQLQRDLEQREAEATRQREALQKLEQAQTEARERIETLNVAVRVAEQEKVLLRETAETFRQQAEAERIERIKVQETTTELAQGVGQLAERSADLSREIRDNRPINANVLYSDFLANRVQTTFAARRDALLGPLTAPPAQTRTLFVTDGSMTYAILHIDDTPFVLSMPQDWTRVEVGFAKATYRTSAASLGFLALDPRVVAIPVDPAQIVALGVRVYNLAADPFKFPDALLISSGGAGYGEVPFKLDPGNPNYVRMDNRLVRRLMGDFSPSRGDLVLSKSGELLGLMVNGDHCVIISNLQLARTFATGDTSSARTSEIFSDLGARVRRLPSRLQ